MKNNTLDYLIAVTGASGSIYAYRLIEELLKKEHKLGLIFSKTGQEVFAYELNLPSSDNWPQQINDLFESENIVIYDNEQLFASPASGSTVAKAMVVIPTSMGTLSRIACGNAKSLLERACDVYIKENKPLLLVPRETPLNAIHLENMLKLSRLGVRIIPAMPGFYLRPKTLDELVDFIVGKVFDALELEHDLHPPWQGQPA